MTAAIPADLDDDIAEAARIIVSAYYSDYLAIRGKSRWCDKSLDNYMFAPLLRQVFPDAQFICLYRHCMDMVASGIEACPLGMSGYGFDAFAHQFPSNNVAAAGACWLTNARDTLEFEEANRERCLRVRYEDLVSDTDQVASSIFNFLGVQQVDDISRLCFESEHDRPGPGDHKIWFTNRILQHSMGRGRKIPGSALPPPLLKEINDALGLLGYKRIDSDWNAVSGHIDPRAEETLAAASVPRHAGVPANPGAPGNGQAGGSAPGAEAAAAAALIAATLSAVPEPEISAVSLQWPYLAGRVVRIVVEGDHGLAAEVGWQFAPGPAVVQPVAHGGDLAGSGEQPESDPGVTFIGSAGTWRSLLAGEANMAAELTASRIRCIGARLPQLLSPPEAAAIAYLLGMTALAPGAGLAMRQEPVEAAPVSPAGRAEVAGLERGIPVEA